MVGVLAIPMTRVVSQYDMDHLGGTSRDVTLTWECWDHVGWDQPGSRWTWLAVGPVSSRLPTSSHPSHFRYGFPSEVARGRMQFDSDDLATFTSDSGAGVTMIRHKDPFFQTLACRIGPVS